MPEADLVPALHSAVNCYLSMLEAAAHAMAEACPDVGRPYGQRLSRLRARLAFDSSAPEIEEGRATTERELANYARKTREYTERQRAELRHALAALEKIAGTLAERQMFYGERLRRTAAQMQMETQYSPESAERHSAALLSCAESMGHEAQSLVKKMGEEMAQAEARLASLVISDPVTGLINRREMERSIAAVKARGETPVLLLFEFRGGLPDEVARQAGARLTLQFRHQDVISRWSERQFLVLFNGSEETARARVEQIMPWIAGRYQLGEGAFLDAAVEASLIDGSRMPETDLAPV